LDTECTPNYAFKPIAEQALRPNQTVVPQRLNAALGLMNKTDVTRLIINSASRFGSRNPQQICQLRDRLSKVDGSFVALGLLDVFLDSDLPPKESAAQELAGELLETAILLAPESLENYIRAVLPRYELSVQQLPKYLARTVGLRTLIETLDCIENEVLPENWLRACKTLKFWLNGFEGAEGKGNV